MKFKHYMLMVFGSLENDYSLVATDRSWRGIKSTHIIPGNTSKTIENLLTPGGLEHRVSKSKGDEIIAYFSPGKIEISPTSNLVDEDFDIIKEYWFLSNV